MLVPLVLTILIVGFVTAGLKIRFDRFFTILLLLFLFKKNIFDSVDVFLWVILFGAIMILFENREKIGALPGKMRVKLFLLVPALALVGTFFGSWLFAGVGASVLIVTLGILAILYGLRLMFIHFRREEMNYAGARPSVVKFSGLAGPITGGFFIGLIGTSLKVPLAVRVGKMNLPQVYLGNTVTTFFASGFALLWHHTIFTAGSINLPDSFLLGAGLWTGIHYVYEFTNLFFPDKWRKSFQIIIGIVLIAASIKVFALL